MAEGTVSITAGTGTNIDVFDPGGGKRQVIVVGDPNTQANVQTVTPAGSGQVTQAASTLSSVTLQSAAVATGNGTVLTVTGYSAAMLTVSGTFVGTVTFEGTEDGTNYSSLSSVQLGTNTIGATATAPGTFEVATSGLQSIRARVSAYTSGTITVTGHASPVAYNGKVINVGNFPASQPVSIATMPSTPVTGTFFQTTQPVSIATAPTTPVTGTFWQATQPVSGTVTASNATGNIASGATDSGNPVKVGGVYNSTAPTLTTGQRGDAQLDSSGNTKITAATTNAGEDLTNQVQGVTRKPVVSSTYSPLIDTSFGTANAHVSKASTGNILSFTCSNVNAAIRYFQIFNTTSTPINTNVPIFSFPIPIGSTTIQVQSFGADFFGQGGYNFATGIAWAVSSTQATLTLGTAADHNVQVTYV